MLKLKRSSTVRSQLGPFLGLSVMAGALLAPASASATPLPRYEDLTSAQSSHPAHSSWAIVPKVLSASPVGSTSVLDTLVDVQLDPKTGQTAVKFAVSLKANTSPVSAFFLYMDPGLQVSAAQVTKATASGTSVTWSDQVQSNYRAVILAINSPLQPGQEVTLEVNYSGTLQCKASTWASSCTIAPPLGLLMEGSALPVLLDQDQKGTYNIWGAKRELIMRVPSGTDVVASGVLSESKDEAGTHTTRWLTPGYHTAGPHMAIFGDLSSNVVPIDPETTVWALPTADLSRGKMTKWMPDVLAFLNDQTGAPLPFPKLNIVNLPSKWALPGTATHGLVLLAESYGAASDEYFEETLAHETSHEWWGILINPTEGRRTRWLTEGLATLSQIDYANAKFRGELSSDRYLGRRYNEHTQVLRYLAVPAQQPALVAQSASQLPTDSVQDNIWAYMRSSATLDYLRVLIGQVAWEKALKAYVKQCTMAHCDTTDFRLVLEQASGLDLSASFERLVYKASYPEFSLNFSQTPQRKDEIALSVTAKGIDAPLLVKLVIGFVDGQEEERVALIDPAKPTELVVKSEVRFVRPHARQRAVTRSRSARAGDIDFDQEVDGLDLIHCALSHGRKAAPNQQPGAGVWGLDMDFRTECDVDLDGKVGDEDLAPQLEGFGSLRAENQ